MSNVLTQDEIDALLAASSSGEMPPDPSATAAPSGAPQAVAQAAQQALAQQAAQVDAKLQNVNQYDFRRPNKFSKDHLRHLQMIHDNFSRIYKPTLSFQLRTNAHLRLIYIEQHTYEEFIDLSNNHTLFAILSFLKGRIVVGIDIPIVLVIIEKLLGGEGNSNLARKELTDIEMGLFHRILERIIASLTEAWGTILTSIPKVEATENNPQIMQIVSPNEIVIKMVIELAIGEDYTGHITLCYPYVTLAPILESLGSHQWVTSEINTTYTKEDEAFINRRIQKTKVPLIFELGKTQILLRDLVKLQEGDVIKLNKKATEKLEVKVGEKTKFLADSGILGKNLAAKIEQVVYPDQDDSFIDRIIDNENKFMKVLEK